MSTTGATKSPFQVYFHITTWSYWRNQKSLWDPSSLVERKSQGYIKSLLDKNSLEDRHSPKDRKSLGYRKSLEDRKSLLERKLLADIKTLGYKKWLWNGKSVGGCH